MKHKNDKENQEEINSNPEENIEQEGKTVAEAETASDYKAKYDELNDKFLRLYSDFDNFRKRTQRERIDLIKTAGEDIYKSLIPVLDDFERALKSAENTHDTHLAEGIKIIYNKLKNTLTQKGLTEMECVGQPFDTDLHEALTNVPVEDEDQKGKVVEVLEKGYLLNGKVIRFAKVVVGS